MAESVPDPETQRLYQALVDAGLAPPARPWLWRIAEGIVLGLVLCGIIAGTWWVYALLFPR